MMKLKSKHTSLKKYANLAKLIYFSFVLREREEKKLNISHPKIGHRLSPKKQKGLEKVKKGNYTSKPQGRLCLVDNFVTSSEAFLRAIL